MDKFDLAVAGAIVLICQSKKTDDWERVINEMTEIYDLPEDGKDTLPYVVADEFLNIEKKSINDLMDILEMANVKLTQEKYWYAIVPMWKCEHGFIRIPCSIVRECARHEIWRRFK